MPFSPCVRRCRTTPGYTRNVSWRHRISLVVLIILTALPVSGTVCAMLCDSAAATRAAAHHGSGKICDEQATPSSGPQMRGASGHDCSDHDAAIRVAATTTATRADSVSGPSLLGCRAGSRHDQQSRRFRRRIRLPHSTWQYSAHRIPARSSRLIPVN